MDCANSISTMPATVQKPFHSFSFLDPKRALSYIQYVANV